MAEETGTPRYSREEVEEILRRAAERTHEDGGDGLAHEDLVAAAHEAGIDVGAVELAVGEVARRRDERKALDVWDGRRRRRFISHLLTWFVVNAGLFLLDLASGGGWWFFYPLVAWGIAVALHAVGSLRAPTPDQIEKVNRRERRRIEAERRRAARRAAATELRDKFRAVRDRRPGAGREFERSVEAGVSALLEVVAKRIDNATGRDQRPLPDSEFNRYVATRKATPMPMGAPPRQSQSQGAERQAQSQGQGPRVRVEPRDREDIEDDGDRTRGRERGRRGRS